MADPGGLQLLPETRRRVEVKGQRKIGSIILGVFLVVLVGAAYIMANIYLTSLNDELANLDQQVMDIDHRRDKDAEKEVRTLNSQLALIGRLLDNHIFWTKGFRRMERLTVSQAKFMSLSGDANKAEITARIEVASYSELARMISAYFSDESVESVDANRISLLANGNLEANLLIKFNRPNFLYSL